MMPFASDAPLVLVEWVDSSFREGWLDRDEVLGDLSGEKRGHPQRCRSVGWVLKRDEHALVLYASENEEGHLMAILEIPAQCVRSERVLRRR